MKPTSPIIALTPRSGGTTSRGYRRLADNENYFTYVQKAGGIPVLTAIVTKEDAEELAQRCDGLLITGGEDVDPALYQQANTDSDLIDRDLEETDLLLYRAFEKAGKTILGICRGIQIINVAEGGTLIQDIARHNPKALQHGQNHIVPAIADSAFSHQVTFCKGTRLHAIYGDTYGVNSFHHQAIDQVAPTFTVSGISEDGYIEAIEKKNVTAVQWHPERLTEDIKHMNLMNQWMEDCRLAKQSV